MTLPIVVCSVLNDTFKSSVGVADWPDIDSPEWIKARVYAYLDYTVPSLIRQTNQNFRIWLNCRLGTEGLLNPYIDDLEGAGVEVTFHARHPDGAGTGDPRTVDLLPSMVNEVQASGQDEFWLIRLDCDDVYAPHVVKTVASYEGDAVGIQFVTGHVLEVATGHLWPWLHMSPPYYAERSRLVGNLAVPPVRFQGHPSFRPVVKPEVILRPSFLVCRHGPAFHGWNRPLPKGPEIISHRTDILREWYGIEA